SIEQKLDLLSEAVGYDDAFTLTVLIQHDCDPDLDFAEKNVSFDTLDEFLLGIACDKGENTSSDGPARFYGALVLLSCPYVDQIALQSLLGCLVRQLVLDDDAEAARCRAERGADPRLLRVYYMDS